MCWRVCISRSDSSSTLLWCYLCHWGWKTEDCISHFPDSLASWILIISHQSNLGGIEKPPASGGTGSRSVRGSTSQQQGGVWASGPAQGGSSSWSRVLPLLFPSLFSTSLTDSLFWILVLLKCLLSVDFLWCWKYSVSVMSYIVAIATDGYWVLET